MAFRATCCGRILSLITRLPRFTGDERLIGVPAQQAGEQSNRPFLNVRRQPLKVRASRRGVKQRRLRDSASASGPWHQHLPEQSRTGPLLVARRPGAPSATRPSIRSRPGSLRLASLSAAGDHRRPVQTSRPVLPAIGHCAGRRSRTDRLDVQICSASRTP
jgi:hypothetical protein